MRSEDWQKEHAAKIVALPTAIQAIPAGRRILVGSGAAVPKHLVEGLVEEGKHLADNELVHLMTLGPARYVRPGLEQRFRHTAFFIGPNVREAVQEGRADFMPVFLSELPALMRSRRLRIDVALVQVSPPDTHGYVSLGVSVDIVRAAVETADLVIAEVNPHMPRTLGDSFLHLDQLDYLVPVDYALPELPPPRQDPVTTEIGRLVASLVPDGATIQAGIGKIPDAACRFLTDHTDLGVHTEMFSDGVMHLYEAGVVTGRRKSILPGKIVTSFIMGTQALYRWAHDNPAIEMRPSNFTNDPFTIARHDLFVAVNSALAVDLTGQVAADTLLGRFFSGIGGQVDFIRGAARSPGGKAIVALPSTAKEGTVSRLQPAFEEGAGVVTSRGDVHFVVTEYGIAHLWGRNIRQRAMALIEIAHPDFRSELLAAAKHRRFVFSDQIVPRGSYPWTEESVERLPGGERVMVRPARLTDEEALQALLYRLSDDSIYKRFLSHKKTHPHEELQQLVDLDYDHNMALVVTLPDDPGEEIIGTARYDVDRATLLADIAFVVRDDWQARGIGRLLLRKLGEIARERGLRGFTADVLMHNQLMLGVLHESGLKLRTRIENGVYHIEAKFPRP
ncbi:MAG: GNAT family N-acetyltransferase [Planctomycetota bacterium]|jgi:acyl-CoA hydrolase/GNAT superfamily N-acetyltransferase